MKRILAFMLLSFVLTNQAIADWHTGAVDFLGFGYDGQTVTFRITGWSRSNCLCYPTWPNYMCLDRSRVSFKEELANLMLAKTSGATLSVYIDEGTCKIQAMYEIKTN